MFRTFIYDALILRLTSRWYEEVLQRLPDRAEVLDVGIGTAGALLANADLVANKDLRITGIDIDSDYIDGARRRLRTSPCAGRVTVRIESVYDHAGGPYDAVYFAASFMLLPDPEGALRHCTSLLKPGGRIYFTQTIQTEPSPWMERMKPMLRWLTSIDFGRVTYEDAFRAQIVGAGLHLDEFTRLGRHGKRAFSLAVASDGGRGDESGREMHPHSSPD
jgi:2-polyprenyl-3-methyl-5-hydroxy-6-metoxy-1,4-benzoquinol methylase